MFQHDSSAAQCLVVPATDAKVCSKEDGYCDGVREGGLHDATVGSNPRQNSNKKQQALSASQANKVPSDAIAELRRTHVIWASRIMGIPTSAIKVCWVSVCAGECSDYAGLEQGDEYESLEIKAQVEAEYLSNMSKYGVPQRRTVKADVIRDVRTVNFCKWEDELQRRHPAVNLIVFAVRGHAHAHHIGVLTVRVQCYPPCTTYSSLNIGANQGTKGETRQRCYTKEAAASGKFDEFAWVPRPGEAGAPARVDDTVMKHCLVQVGKLWRRHFA